MAEVTVTLPAQLASALGGGREAKIKASNLRELIKALGEVYGEALTRRLIDQEGKLNPIINIYINGRNIRFTGNLETPLKEGDKITILPAVAGG
ncbi:MAG: MoaD family protein [Nitrososphaerales archaeon]